MVIADGPRRRRDRGVGRRHRARRRWRRSAASPAAPSAGRRRSCRCSTSCARSLESLPGDRPRVLVVDDLDALEDAAAQRLLGAHPAIRPRCGSSPRSRSRNISGFSMDPLLNEVRKARRALYLQPDDPVELFQTIGVRPPIRPGTPMPPGRGVLVDRSPPDADPGRVARTTGRRRHPTPSSGSERPRSVTSHRVPAHR